MAARGEEDGGVFFCFGREPRGRELWFFFFFLQRERWLPVLMTRRGKLGEAALEN
jgi:hypothetical protein